MADELQPTNEFREPKPFGRPKLYDWDMLLDGKPRLLKPGRDFDPKGADVRKFADGIRAQATAAASKRGLKITAERTYKDELILQAYDPEKTNGRIPVLPSRASLDLEDESVARCRVCRKALGGFAEWGECVHFDSSRGEFVYDHAEQ